ncbi:MAG: tetratricopeptide repeat protein, partial [Candidatus Neomarinimicrobiota bacterium]
SYEQDGNLVKAVEAWQKFALADPEQGECVFPKIESALFDLGRFSEIERFYRQVLDLAPGNVEALVNLAHVLDEKGDRKGALQLVDDALHQNEGDIHARLMKLKLKVQNGSPSVLARELDQIIEDLPSRNLPV